MTAQSAIGRFHAVGVGPGDPQLLTLRAQRVLQAAEVVYHAGPEPTRGRAYDIVAAQLRPEQQLRCVLTASMTAASAGAWRQVYRPAVDAIAAECRAGRHVAFITEGDPTLYSTAAYVWQLLAELHPDIGIEVVPGVTSITAAAARARMPLVQKDETLAIVPAHYHAASVGDWLERSSAVAFLKPTAALGAIAAGLGQREAVYLENVGRGDEYLTRNLQEAAGRDCYFSLVLAPAGTPRREQPGEPSASVGGVTVVGLGPGALDLLTPRALRALRSADIVVGYDAYLQSLAPLQLRAELRGSPIGAEQERARLALELARAGKQVALVSSGDAGVYGMASLLLETASAADLEVDIVPGVTAATAAAALLGAPLGHDFACISLSDLLTPWEVIQARVDAAARADFVVALYNPISRQRTWQLQRARDCLLQHRELSTPVGVVDRAHRPGQRTWLTTLGQFHTDGIGMETILIVGNSQTRVIQGRMVTPRGYRQEEPATAAEKPLSPLAFPIIDVSFAIIERELGRHDLPPFLFAVVRRMIHASADFDFARTVQASPGFKEAIRAALAAPDCVIVTDTEMVREGLRSACRNGPPVLCYLNDPAAKGYAEIEGMTRSAAGIRAAARHHPRPILAIGNAPTALEEALWQVEHEGWRPVAIIGMPVGFVGVIEAKERLLEQSVVPYLTCIGNKGGSAVTAAAVNALIDWCKNP